MIDVHTSIVGVGAGKNKASCVWLCFVWKSSKCKHFLSIHLCERKFVFWGKGITGRE